MKLAASPQPSSAVEPVAAAFRGGWLQRQGLEVSQPGDALETEATSAARQVVQMPAPSLAPSGATRLPSAASTPARIQRQTQGGGAGAPADAAVARLPARLAAQRGQGQALPTRLRRDMEARFGARFDGVRVHTGSQAAALSRGLQARAFTTSGDVFFGDGEFQPDSASGRELLAHELAHTVQQGAAPVIQPASSAAAAGAAAAPRIQRSVAAGLSRAPSDGLTRVMRVALPGAVLNTLAGLAANLPGFTLLTVVLGRNPINGAAVDRSIVNLLRGFIGLIPGGEALWQVLQRYGVIETLGSWAQQAVAALGLTFDMVRGAFTRFVDSLGLLDVLDPGGVWDRARAIFGPIVARITAFVERLITQAVAAVKAALMPPLSEFCRQVPGYGLVTVMLGRDPFTDAPVARTPLAIVRAFAEFIPGGSEKVDQLVQSGALDRAYQWFVAETISRNLTWARVTGTFAAAWASLQLSDILQPIATLQRIVGMFRPLMSDLIGFAGAALMKLLELIYEAAMGAGGRRILDILTRARGTFNIIIRDPVGFLRNLLGAVGQGVRQFMSNILTHLRDGVIAWLTGPVAAAGIQMPERWDLRGIIGFVLQILGLTWARVRTKLVTLLGERVVAGLEAGFQLLLDIRDRGLVAALRDRVTEFFGSLREAALGAIRSFIQQRLVMAGITQLLSMLNPVGAIIQAIIKTYTTIQFFIQRINQILDLVESVVNSIGAIASGAIGAAASFVERTMARTIPVVLDFLARFIGLGDVGAQVQRTIRNLQASVDRMLDRVVGWIRTQAARVAGTVRGAVASVLQWWRRRFVFRAGGESHALQFQGEDDNAELMVASTPRRIQEYVDTARQTRTTPAQVAAIGRIVAQLPIVSAARTQLRTLRRANATEAAMQPQLTVLDGALRAIGTEIGGLMDGENSGRDSDAFAIPIAWPKPAWNQYPTLHLYRVGSTWKLTARTRPNDLLVKDYRPAGHLVRDGSIAPPADLDSLGITSRYRLQAGTRGPRLSNRETPGGATLNNLLARYGWSASEENMDGDHVQEIQFGGDDVLGNLWPLNASMNRGAGSALSRLAVRLGSESLTVDLLKRVVLSSQDQAAGKFTFRISAMASPPPV